MRGRGRGGRRGRGRGGQRGRQGRGGGGTCNSTTVSYFIQ